MARCEAGMREYKRLLRDVAGTHRLVFCQRILWARLVGSYGERAPRFNRLVGHSSQPKKVCGLFVWAGTKRRRRAFLVKDLDRWHGEIDAIDARILRWLSRRAKIAVKLGRLKRIPALPRRLASLREPIDISYVRDKK
jgi:hypothetical protein